MNQTYKNISVIRCRCGEVELQLTGKPILTAVCHCDDCQRAAHELELLPNAPQILDSTSGTPYVLYRKDRVACIKGNSLLRDHRIEKEAFTKRVIAACCNSPLYLDFEKGHWLSLHRDRFGDNAPPIQMRTQTRFIPKTVSVPSISRNMAHIHLASLGG